MKTPIKNPPKPTKKKEVKHVVAKKKSNVDWDTIEKEYCIGQKSTRAIGYQFGVSHTAVQKTARKEGWVQDKTKEIRAKTNAGLASFQEGVSKKVSTPTQDDIEKAVQTNIQVITGHRKSIGFGQRILDILFAQLKDVSEHREDLEAGIDEECTRGDGTKDYHKKARLLKSLALPSNAQTLEKLTAAQKNLIAMERQAFNIDKTEDPEDAVVALLKLASQQPKPLVREGGE